MYINDIANASKHFDFIIYADHTAMSTTLKIIYRDTKNTEEMVNSEVTNINDFPKINKLYLNTGKCKYMIFHIAQKKIDPLQLKIDNIIIDRVKELNCLGLTLNEHFNYNSHINKMANKISRSM